MGLSHSFHGNHQCYPVLVTSHRCFLLDWFEMGTPRLLYLSALFCLLHAVLNCQGSPSEIEGKVVLVTGGTTGIGFATALRFAQKGSLVVFCAKNESQGLMSQLAIRYFTSSLLLRKSGVYMRARERERERESVCVYDSVSVCFCVRLEID